MLPKAGGGGKEGVVHKEAWDTLATKTVHTLDHLAGLLFSIVPSMKNSNKATGETLIDLPRLFFSLIVCHNFLSLTDRKQDYTYIILIWYFVPIAIEL
jgi:hypothetical protein